MTTDTYADAEVDYLDDELESPGVSNDPRTNVEALCLCAILWSSPPTAMRVTTALRASDFYEISHADLFAFIAGQISTGRPHDPASIDSALIAGGTTHHTTMLLQCLTSVITAGALPEAASHYALAVAQAGYRRGFVTAATRLTQAAEELPEGDLFDHLVGVGRERRAAAQRMDALRHDLASTGPRTS